MLFNDFHVGNIVKTFSIRVVNRVSIIKPVHLGCLEKDLGMNLLSPQNCGRIGRKIRIACPGCKNNDAASFQMSSSPSADIRLGYLVHGNSCLNTGLYSTFFQCVLKSKTVHDCRQHPHMIRRGSLHAIGTCCNTPENIAPANNDSKFDTHFIYGLNLPSDISQHLLTDTERLVSHEGFATQF